MPFPSVSDPAAANGAKEAPNVEISAASLGMIGTPGAGLDPAFHRSSGEAFACVLVLTSL